ncbi:MAG: glycosyltransferase family 2 protein [Caldilineaceae bacterium]|nr:glycosyltransferase family 2 protein [Caldilineaceae bacterium]
MPQFSIILTTYNRATVLPRAISSVLQQTYRDYELLIIDDASPDATHQVVAAFNDDRIRYIRLPCNAGVSTARNQGIQESMGESLVFLDDDDALTPEFLEETHRALQEAPANVGFLWTWKRVYDIPLGKANSSEVTYGVYDLRVQPGNRFFESAMGGTGGLIVRRRCLAAVGGFDESFRVVGDTEALIRLADRYDFIIIPEALYAIFNIESNQLTKPTMLRAQSIERLLQKNRDILRRHPHLFATFSRQSARIYYQVGEPQQGRRVLKQALANNPLSWKSWVLLTASEGLQLLPASARQAYYAKRSHKRG